MAAPIDPMIFEQHPFEPLLALGVPRQAFEAAGAEFTAGEDDLDSYMMTAIALADGFPFVLLAYDHARQAGLDVFVMRGAVQPDDIHTFVRAAAQELQIDEDLFVYRRDQIERPGRSGITQSQAEPSLVRALAVPSIRLATAPPRRVAGGYGD